MSFIKCGVIGYPIKHSKSPIIHNHWIAQHGLQGEYKAIEIAPERLQDSVQALVDEGYAGFNVTIPYKQAIMALCAEIDETAKAIGAVNTVSIRDGKLYGANTDAFGFIENVKRSTFGTDFLHHPAVVLGAGGAARAVVYALIEAGAKQIMIANRTSDKAEDIAAMNKDIIRVADWSDRSKILQGAGFLVNTTALGMSGKEPLDINLSLLPKDAVVGDIVYAPLMTELLKNAEIKGHQIVTGIGMLLHQARPAFEKWFGVLPDVDEALEKKGAGMITIGLTGSIGMGKSTAARMLRLMGVPVHDSDRAIHIALQPGGNAHEQVARLFPAVRHPVTGMIDRQSLGSIVFQNKAALKQLEAILHPAARQSAVTFIQDAEAMGKKAVVLDIPLLFETGAEGLVDYTICVSSPPDIQKKRVMRRPGMTEEKFHAILASQMPDDEKRTKSYFVVETGDGYIKTFFQLWKILKKTGVR